MTERPTPEPTLRLAREARGLFTLEALGWALPLAAAGIAGGIALGGAGGAAIAAAAVLAALTGAVVVPDVRVRRFRYEVREDEIDLRRGAFTVVRTLVPMVRVQHVDTRRTVLSQMFGLASVVFHTAAGATSIPALREVDAAAIRDRIADLARTPEEL